MKQFIFYFFYVFGLCCFLTLFASPLIMYLSTGEGVSYFTSAKDTDTMAANLAIRFLWYIIASTAGAVLLLKEKKRRKQKKEKSQAKLSNNDSNK
ncbi:MAG: hypothetical protein LBI82_01250 [Dysgonamonadaceae bacterium]|jgi:hypothetical protein|nr:hypothetical protein [Dysgonamonadaceae bacterium]